LHLNLSSTNFGIQELHLFSDVAREVFLGTPEVGGAKAIEVANIVFGYGGDCIVLESGPTSRQPNAQNVT
jgi:hypothetical protein